MIAIYLAGNIQKGHEKESGIFWTKKDQDIISAAMAPQEVAFLNPAIRTDDLRDQKSVFGRDMTQVYMSHAVFVDARERRGLGVGAEMMWAKMNRIPLIILAPRNSHYRKEECNLLGVEVKNWVHPFVESLSDAIVDTVEEGAKWLRSFCLEKGEVKGPESIQEAMLHYQENQLGSDEPMRELIEGNSDLAKRMVPSETGQPSQL
jgi:hypothetical protein